MFLSGDKSNREYINGVEYNKNTGKPVFNRNTNDRIRSRWKYSKNNKLYD